MNETMATVMVPVPAHRCDLLVFPAPAYYQDRSNSFYYVFQNSEQFPGNMLGSLEVEYVPGMIYCFLPSTEKWQGRVRLYTAKPNLLDSYLYCFEVKKETLIFTKREATGNNIKNLLTDFLVTGCSERCSGCFVRHFPSPNTLKCKLRKKNVAENPTELRLRGGAGNESLIFQEAIANAKKHGIDVHADEPNSADGNCVFESVMSSINNRNCFGENLEESPDYYRKKWLEEVEKFAYDQWNLGKTKAEWKHEWSILQNSRTYQYDLGDLILPGIAHCIRKDILVFNTSSLTNSPVYVIESSRLAGEPNSTEVPICLAYNQVHYEALFPNTEDNVMRTIRLKRDIIEGNYQKYENEFIEKQNCESEVKVENTLLKSDPLHSELNLKHLAELKKIKKKDRTKEQNELYKSLMRQKRNERERERQAKIRAGYSIQDKDKINENRRLKMAAMQVEKKVKQNEKCRNRMSKSRKKQSATKKNDVKEKQRKRMAAKRSGQTIAEQYETQEKERTIKASKQTSIGYKECLRSTEILEGCYIVLDIEDSPDNIGKMNKVCPYCGALKFRRETSTTCCSNGKVVLDGFPKPPEQLDKLWHADTVEGRVLRENARSINNAVCLTSIKVKTKDFGKGFSPNVIFEGKATQLAGPLQATEGERPYFAQLYLHDPNLESSERFRYMTIPANMSKSQKMTLEQLLVKIQKILHDATYLSRTLNKYWKFHVMS